MRGTDTEGRKHEREREHNNVKTCHLRSIKKGSDRQHNMVFFSKLSEGHKLSCLTHTRTANHTQFFILLHLILTNFYILTLDVDVSDQSLSSVNAIVHKSDILVKLIIS